MDTKLIIQTNCGKFFTVEKAHISYIGESILGKNVPIDIKFEVAHVPEEMFDFVGDYEE